jgi:type VI secretion system secreted protein Hcp
MAFDAFVIFYPGDSAAAPAITGESMDPTYGKKGAFEISEFSFGAETTISISSATGGAGAGKCTFKEFTVKKLVDLGSPYLLQTLGAGGHYDKVKLFIRKAGGASKQSGAAYLIFCFSMVAVKSIEWSGSTGDDVPTETVIFDYGLLLLGYSKQDKSGKLTDTQYGGWSKLENCALPGGTNFQLTNTDVGSTP